ncbi:GNAT family N-acetyltransferase [Acidovorax sp. sic0104]|uniref:GNAT family N-acetyltransferase n=1 Tax=Acidovorax sp. sic0104 TaxID=2854784 RepID=UPI001C46210E|nr:GNAT family N-acetyltransferase [Acidovorax sp. sic0104]MBV7539826.1 GNAT family N-acetyltransferase [Acidovorax sp. sic0104]
MAALPAPLQIRLDDLSDPRIEAFMQEHLQDMYAASPPESVHALDMDQLRQPGIAFWSAWLAHADGDTLVGTGALKRLDADHAELKSMRTSARHRGQGIARQVLAHLLQEARARGFSRVSLETGPQPFFEPARQLYFQHDFVECGPFADYVPDPYSFFMTRPV